MIKIPRKQAGDRVDGQNPEIITDGTFCITDGTACLEAKLQKVAGNKTEFWSLGSSIDQAWKLIVEMVVWNEDVE